MILRSLKLIHKNQRGFTLIELVIAVAIVGIITSGITMTMFGVFDGNTRSTNHMIAIRQVQNAGYWVSRDTQMAQSVTPDAGATGFPLTLTWTDWETGDEHQVVYDLLSPDNKLQRSYSVDGVPSGATFTAEFIDTANTSCALAAGGKLTLTVTATVGDATETRTYEVIPRPSV